MVFKLHKQEVYGSRCIVILTSTKKEKNTEISWKYYQEDLKQALNHGPSRFKITNLIMTYFWSTIDNHWLWWEPRFS